MNSGPSDRTLTLGPFGKSCVEDLVTYADVAAKILREQGFPGKAEALEERNQKVAVLIGLK